MYPIQTKNLLFFFGGNKYLAISKMESDPTNRSNSERLKFDIEYRLNQFLVIIIE